MAGQGADAAYAILNLGGKFKKEGAYNICHCWTLLAL
jgi:hypothetical protein